MYKSFLALIQCPNCKSEQLTTSFSEQTEEQIIKGNIHCEKCGSNYPVVDGIPLMVDEQKQKEVLENWNTSSGYEEYTLKPTNQVKKMVQQHSKGTKIALDSGCGSGAYTSLFASDEIICVDLVPFFLKKLRAEYTGQSKLHITVADIRKLPLKQKTADIVFCSQVLEHLKKDEFNAVIQNYTEISKQTVLVDVPNESGVIVQLFRNLFGSFGFYHKNTASDDNLHHHCQFGVNDFKSMNFKVHGCIGWVSASFINIGPVWQLYDKIVWSHPSLGGTIIGVRGTIE